MSWSYVSALGKWWWRKGGAGWDGRAGRGFSGGAGWTRDGAASLHFHTSYATTGQKPGAGLWKVTLKMFLMAQKSCFSRKYVEVAVRYRTEALVASPQPPWWSQERSQQDTWLQPELLDESSCGGTSCLVAEMHKVVSPSWDAHGGLTLMRCTWRFHPYPSSKWTSLTLPWLWRGSPLTLLSSWSDQSPLIWLNFPRMLYILFLLHWLISLKLNPIPCAAFRRGGLCIK